MRRLALVVLVVTCLMLSSATAQQQTYRTRGRRASQQSKPAAESGADRSADPSDWSAAWLGPSPLLSVKRNEGVDVRNVQLLVASGLLAAAGTNRTSSHPSLVADVFCSLVGAQVS